MERLLQRHTHTHKAPFRTRAYTDIKGPLFSPSYRYFTAGLCCEHIYVTCFMSANVCVWEKPQCMQWTLADTLDTPELTVTRVLSACAQGVLFLCEQLRNNSSSTNNAQRGREQLCLWRRLFVVVETQEMRSCWGLGLCAPPSLLKSRARPGGEYQSLISRPRQVYESVRNSSFSAMYENKVMVTPGTAVSPSTCLPSSSYSLDSNPPLKLQSVIVKHTKAMASPFDKTKLPFPLIPKTASVLFHFKLQYLKGSWTRI